jgi:hypothetical protein
MSLYIQRQHNRDCFDYNKQEEIEMEKGLQPIYPNQKEALYECLTHYENGKMIVMRDIVDINIRLDKKTFSPKSKSSIEEKQTFKPLVSILGKRKFYEAFEQSTFDDDRYDQHLIDDFFNTNVGHNVLQVKEIREIYDKSNYDVDENLKLCEFYLANKNLFNV